MVAALGKQSIPKTGVMKVLSTIVWDSAKASNKIDDALGYVLSIKNNAIYSDNETDNVIKTTELTTFQTLQNECHVSRIERD